MNDKLERRESVVHGYGLFAKCDIRAGERLVEYLGEKIKHEEAERREKENDLKGESGLTYIFWLDETHEIDGAVGGSDAKWVNHSCDPNVEVHRENGRIYFYSKRAIRAGEELFVDYAFDKDDTQYPCSCGSVKCRGVMNEV